MDVNNVLVVRPDTQYKVLDNLVLDENGWRLPEGNEIVDLVIGTVLTMDCVEYDMEGKEGTIILFKSERDGFKYPFYRWPEIKLAELAKALDEDWIEVYNG